MKQTIIILLSTLLLLNTSCNKNKLKKCTLNTLAFPGTYTFIIIESNGVISELSSSKETIKLYYSNGKLSKKEKYKLGAQLPIATYTFQYSGNNLIKRLDSNYNTGAWNLNGTLDIGYSGNEPTSAKYTYNIFAQPMIEKYYWTNGNLTKIETFDENNTLTATQLLTYDLNSENLLNTYYSDLINQGDNTYNGISLACLKSKNTINASLGNGFIVSKNIDSFPTKITQKIGAVGIELWVITYNCK
jgi:hypothetical protein